MPEPSKPHDDDRIEDLLSQLQGIFGRLSQSDEEESQKKLDVPQKPQSTPPSEPPPPAPEPPPPEPKIEVPPEPVPMPIAPAEIPEVLPQAPVEPPVPPEPPPPAEPIPSEPMMSVPAAEPPAPAPAAGGFNPDQTPTGIFYPAGRDAEAKSLAEKLETMTPKFTKVSFRLQVAWMETYDPKVDWREKVLAKAATDGTRAFFIIVDRPIDDQKRRALMTELEGRSVYFQDVPALSIEKKAFYTDLLLGLVFFFDSLKPRSEG